MHCWLYLTIYVILRLGCPSKSANGFLGSTLSVEASLCMLWLSYFATKRLAIEWIRQKWPALL